MNMALTHDADMHGRRPQLAWLKDGQLRALPVSPSADEQRVMRLIEDRLDDIADAVPARCRHHFAEALLRIAMEYIGR